MKNTVVTGIPVEKILVRPAEAAAMLSMSRSRLYELLASGAIPSIRFDNGRTLRIPLAALEKLVADAMAAANGITAPARSAR